MSVPPPTGWTVPPPPGPAPLHLPQYDATIGQAASRFFRKFADFSGRASRSEYWWWFLVSACLGVVLQVAGRLAVGDGFATVTDPTDLRAVFAPLVPSLVLSLVLLLPTLALGVRRLHDTNRSGWWYLLALPGNVGAVLLLVALSSLDVERLAAGDLSGLAVGPLVAGFVLTLIGAVGSVALIVFFALGPDPRGVRFDRRG